MHFTVIEPSSSLNSDLSHVEVSHVPFIYSDTHFIFASYLTALLSWRRAVELEVVSDMFGF